VKAGTPTLHPILFFCVFITIQASWTGDECSMSGPSIGRTRREEPRLRVSNVSTTKPASDKDKISRMSDMNKLVEQGWSNRVADQPLEKPQIDPSFMTDFAWEQWLWHEDPLEESHIDLLLNRMQLLGLLIARCAHHIACHLAFFILK
jgi:hypothetical protein